MTDGGLIRVEVDGRSIAFQESGDGPALVLLHGFLCDSRCWRTQLADLSAEFRVVAWDAPGAGESADPPDSFTITDWAHALATLLDLLNVRQADLVGLSWGGVLAQEVYRLYPSRVSRLILADTYAGWKGSLPESEVEKRLERCERDSLMPSAEFTRQWVPEMFTEAASQVLLAEMSAIISDFHPLGFRLMARSLAETDTTHLLPKIQAPTLVLWGEDDRRSPLTIGQQMLDAIPGAEFAVIEKAGHVSNMEQPEEFNDHIRRFCSSA